MTFHALRSVVSRLVVQILTMSSDEEVAYAAIAAVSQAKMGLYSPLLKDANSDSTEIGPDARMLAKMLVTEEKKVLSDLRHQLMSVVSHLPVAVCAPFSFRRHSYVRICSIDLLSIY